MEADIGSVANWIKASRPACIADPAALAAALSELAALTGMERVKRDVADQLLFALDLLRRGERSPHMMHTILMGKPGTGKTQLAHILAKIWTSLGILAPRSPAERPRQPTPEPPVEPAPEPPAEPAPEPPALPDPPSPCGCESDARAGEDAPASCPHPEGADPPASHPDGEIQVISLVTLPTGAGGAEIDADFSLEDDESGRASALEGGEGWEVLSSCEAIIDDAEDIEGALKRESLALPIADSTLGGKLRRIVAHCRKMIDAQYDGAGWVPPDEGPEEPEGEPRLRKPAPRYHVSELVDFITRLREGFGPQRDGESPGVETPSPAPGVGPGGEAIVPFLPAPKAAPFVVATRAELIGQYQGQTAVATRRVLESARGGVLFVDETYGIVTSTDRNGDAFGRECLNTINSWLDEHADEIIVIFAGYEEHLEDTIFAVQPGLKRRFPWKFRTEDYTPDQLAEIFASQARRAGCALAPDAGGEWLAALIRANRGALFENFAGDTLRLVFYSQLALARENFAGLVESGPGAEGDSQATTLGRSAILAGIRRLRENTQSPVDFSRSLYT